MNEHHGSGVQLNECAEPRITTGGGMDRSHGMKRLIHFFSRSFGRHHR